MFLESYNGLCIVPFALEQWYFDTANSNLLLFNTEK